LGGVPESETEVLVMQRGKLTGIGLIFVVVAFFFQVIRLWPILTTRLSDVVPPLLVHIGALGVAASLCMKVRRNESVAAGEIFLLATSMVASWVLDLRLLSQFAIR